MPGARTQLAAMACVVIVVASVVITTSAFSRPVVAAQSARWLPDSATTWFQLSNESTPLSLTTGVEPGDPTDVDVASAGIATLYEAAVVQARPATPDAPYSPFAAERILVAGRDGISLAGGLLAGRRSRFLPRPLLVPSRPTTGQVWSTETTLEIVRFDGTTASVALRMAGRVERIDSEGCVTISRTVATVGDEPDRITEIWCPRRGRVSWKEQDVNGVIRAASPTARPDLVAPATGQPSRQVLKGGATWIRQPIDRPTPSGKSLLADPSAPPVAVADAVIDFGSRVAAATALDIGGAGVRWQVPTGSPPIGRAFTDGGVLVVTTAAGDVAGLDAGTGFVRWRQRIGAVIGLVTIASGTAVLGRWDGTVVALDAATGNHTWSTRLDGRLRSISAVQQRTAVIDAGGRLTMLDEFGREIAAVDIGHRPSGDLAVIDEKLIVGTDDGHILIVGTGGSIVSDLDASPVHSVRLNVSGGRALAWEASTAKGEVSAVVVDPGGSVSPVSGVGVVAATALPNGWFTVTDDSRSAVISLQGTVGSVTNCGVCHQATLPLAVGPDMWFMAPAGVLGVPNGAR